MVRQMSSVSLMPESGNGRRAESAGSESDPELNVYQCGTYQMHSLQEAQDIARSILERDVRINSNEELALPKRSCRNCTSSQ
ncbi:hypothetical protein ECZU23_51500 [Escherichia coli]|nr:hypothetical protein ECZU23_51500 [Escherichia coli]